mmetsp:Transcript_1516/g.5190  ORF Transcript_1516/g.5190 Transcript_1516/m.5190 type:complete len:122 (-) Transcript_1516:4002-4367(-)
MTHQPRLPPYQQFDLGSHRFSVPFYYNLSETLGNGSFGVVVKASLNRREMVEARMIRMQMEMNNGSPAPHRHHNSVGESFTTHSYHDVQQHINCAIKKVTNIFSKGNFEFQKVGGVGGVAT